MSCIVKGNGNGTEGVSRNLRLEVTVADLSLVQNSERFKNLPGDCATGVFRHGAFLAPHVVAEVAMLDILHRDV